MAKLKDGFYKLTASSIGSDLLVLLAGGGAKPISDFASAFNVKLWGNTFNGSSDVNGAIQFATAGNTGSIKFLNGEFIDGYGNFHLGSNSASWNIFDNNQNYLFTILKSGNVGIGTTSPSYKLDVDGTIRATKSIESIALNDGYWSGGIRIDGTETIRPSVGFHISNLYGRRLFMEETKGDLMWECSSTSGKPTYYILHSGNYLTFVSKMYWANVLISSTSNSATKPTFSNTIVNGVLTVNGGAKALTINHNHTLSGAWNDFIACLNPNLTTTYHTAHITFGRTYDSKNTGYIGFKYAGSASNSNMVTIGLHSVDNVLNILASGNVGIGTLLPAYKLDVVGSIQSSDTVYGKAVTVVGDSTTPYLPNINWFDLTKNVGFHVSYRLTETAKPLRFYYKNSDTFTLLVDITSSGSVGIGTTSPIHKLQVAGAGVFNNTGSTTYATNGITIGAGDATSRYITCFGKTGLSYINVGYGPGINNSGEFFFNYVSSGSTSNYSGVGIYGGANYMYLYPDYTTFRKPLVMPGELYSGNCAINMSNSDIININALYTADNAESGTEGLQFSRGNGYYDSIWASSGTLYFSPNGNLNRAGSYSNNYTVWHTGNLNMGLTTITKSIRVTTSWLNTGITGANIGTGSFVVLIVSINDNTNGGLHWSETYTGLMSSFSGTTNSTVSDEIPLHRAGHAPNSSILYLRTLRLANSGYMQLQIAGNYNMSAAQNITFKFRRII